MKTVKQLQAEWSEYNKKIKNSPDDSLSFEKDGCFATYYPQENALSVGTESEDSVSPKAARELGLWLVAVTEGLE